MYRNADCRMTAEDSFANKRLTIIRLTCVPYSIIYKYLFTNAR